MTLPYGPFVKGISDDERNAGLDRLAQVFPSTHTRQLEIARRWLRVARMDWCEESCRGLHRSIDELPTRDLRHILARYGHAEAADRERQKA